MELPTIARYLRGQRYIAQHVAFPADDPLAASENGGNRICRFFD